MEKEKRKSPVEEAVEEFTSKESNIRWISFACVLIVTLLGIIALLLYDMNKNIHSLIDLLEDGEYNRVVDVFYENENTSTTTEPDSTIVNSVESTTKSENITSTTKPQSNTNTYVINKSSKKIHLQSCSFADRIKEDNKNVLQLTKEELQEYLQNGYTKCSTCGG